MTPAQLRRANIERFEGLLARTTDVLERNRDVLERCARELLAHETLDEPALRALTSGLRPV